MSWLRDSVVSKWYEFRPQRAVRDPSEVLGVVAFLAKKTRRFVRGFLADTLGGPVPSPPPVVSQTAWEVLEEKLFKPINITLPAIAVYILALIVTVDVIYEVSGFWYFYNTEIKAFFTQGKSTSVI